MGWRIFMNAKNGDINVIEKERSFKLVEGWNSRWTWRILERAFSNSKVDGSNNKRWSFKSSEDTSKDTVRFVKPIYVGRDEVVDRIRSFVRDSKQGALFIGGMNGAGKTSAVCESLYGLKNQVEFLTINHLFLKKDVEIEESTYSLIKQLVRALYDKYKDFNIVGLKELYKEVNATKVVEKSKEGLKVVWVSNLKLNQFLSVISWVVVGLGASNFIRIFLDASSNHLITAAFGVLETIVGVIGLSMSKQWEYTEEKEIEVSGLSIHDLQVKTSNVITNLEKYFSTSELKKEIVIVFDELDHYEKDGIERIEDLLVTIKALKLLFQSSCASFIFIIGEKTYNKLNESSVNSTLATDKLSLSIPKLRELKQYVALLFDNNDEFNSSELLVQYMSLLIKRSKGNYYKLTQEIRNDLDYSKNPPQLNLTFNFSNTQRVVSVLVQVALEIMDSYSREGGLEEENEVIFKEMMRVINHYEDVTLRSVSTDYDLPLQNTKERVVVSAFIDRIFNRMLAQVNSRAKVDLSGNKVSFDWSVVNLIDLKVLRDFKGPASEPEVEFDKEYKELEKEIGELVTRMGVSQKAQGLSFEELGIYIFKELNIDSQILDQYLKNISLVIKSIRELDVSGRGLELSVPWNEYVNREGLTSVRQVRETLSKNIIGNTSPVVVKRTGLASADKENNLLNIELENRDHERGNEFASLVTIQKKLSKQFNIKGTVTLRPGAILNFIFSDKEWKPDHNSREFFMLRLDTRSASDCGSLYKPKGKDHFQSHKPSGKGPVAANETIKVYVRHFNNILSLSIGTWNNVVAQVKLEKILWWGVGNELDSVNISLDMKED